jgi:hypothetical protein
LASGNVHCQPPKGAMMKSVYKSKGCKNADTALTSLE